MDYKRREEIFSKEVITTRELAELLSCSESEASLKIREIKMKTDRLHIKGKVHVADYLEYFALSSHSRYDRAEDTVRKLGHNISAGRQAVAAGRSVLEGALRYDGG